MPISEFAGDWKNAPSAGDSTWTRNRLELGANYGNWTVGYTQRFDYRLEYNRDTADLYYRNENNLPARQGDVPVFLRIDQLRAQGFKIGYRHRWQSGIFARVSVTALEASDFQAGQLAGTLNAEGDFFSGTADLDYRYTKDLLLEHQFDMPQGRGFTTDLAVGYSGSERTIQIQLQDLYNRIDWELAPHTYGKFDTIDRDVEDKVQLNPLFSGKRLLEDFRQKMPMYGLASYTEHARGGADVKLDVEYYGNDLRYTTGLLWDHVPGNPYLGYELVDRQWLLSVGDDNGIWKLQLGFDDPDLEKAHSLTIAMAVAAYW
ncbi:hypothetical protein ACONUD_13445 [Microbulbifer harenosus]|uniref:DUF3570 domain-containing protein n=1 Tax=Microbulbifer harenosus TaxID=2576840 RepID=A0ABY2ULL1_9GAMM|nr:hypothetical protein [Microbulbifer harenosus]TLM79333.1 hypothetical protein FDY93_04360 [Microbulbifer harenosus]